ncbi:hypothetical protein QL285_085153 [Trifolium repens]|nr:hypothetical protein QL285_085153 [Trifolium repens]
MKYIKGTCEYGILYTHDTNSILVGYCDVDWASNADDIKSTLGGCFFLGNNLISWFSKRQNNVSLSTAEAEYIAACSSCTQLLLWMKQMLKEYGVKQDVMTLYCDNLSAINISKYHVQHSRTKHIDIIHHFIRELVEDNIVSLEHVVTEKQLADIFTKALDANQFEKLRVTIEAYPLVDELTSKISTLNLERAYRLKSRLVALTRRVQKVRDEIKQLMDNDGDMAEMYLTEKKRQMKLSFYGD